MYFLGLTGKSEKYPDFINLDKVIHIKVKEIKETEVTVVFKFENNESVTLADLPIASYERIVNALRKA
ncbi:hypothetical protein D11S_2207 [Aggregatibacter actinomycetemcomitans D11S-1]|uniref:hypothetical protein n=1 Tax=Aggregatibacter actinomycetemcomitans TaxID=714 RepID=UPI0001B9F705|nr:hypothetical protein [Aggregatibacter actinomycetemcomitans]ACX83558.1 hypothetical protein D11S_2207 [Aggregatibacter actinomycetemcomitans D11S-1]KOE31986.1 hypothetical protein D17P3_0301500 [Aggregatibacter actinomycetemcomitans D17P-3]KOE61955.1 hypothetical protein D17P2_0305310 [Aggregatibacter actinomycetemcomitans serotype c str. D17P-2]